MIVGITKCAGPMNKYNEAMSEINKGNYITAASLFKESNYADGIKQSNMAWAHQFATKGDYDSLLYNVISASGSVNVTYDTNGGDYIPAENISTYGHGITKKATREGFSFTRWTLSNYYIPHIQNTYTASMTLKAVWDKATYDISYELSGGEISSNAPKTYIYGKDCYIPNPTKNGYTFEGWSKNNSTVKYKDLNLKLEQGNVTLKAYWSYDGDRSQTYSNAYSTITNHILKDGTITSSDPLTYQLITKTKNVGNETHLGGFIYKPNFNTFYFNFKHYKTATPSKAIDYSIAFPQEMTSINTGTIFVDNRNDKFALHTVPQDLTKGDQLILTLEFNLSSDEIDTLKTDSETAMSYYTSYFKETLDILGYKLGDFGFNNF